MANNTTSVDVDKYLINLTEENREILQKIREIIKSVVPEAEECISYGIPAFKYNGMLVCYAAFKNHFSFFPMNPAVIEQLKVELNGFKIAKGTIQFTKEKVLPAKLIRMIVKTRVEENLLKK